MISEAPPRLAHIRAMTTFLQWLAAEIEQRTKPRPMCESEAIAWLISL